MTINDLEIREILEGEITCPLNITKIDWWYCGCPKDHI